LDGVGEVWVGVVSVGAGGLKKTTPAMTAIITTRTPIMAIVRVVIVFHTVHPLISRKGWG